MAIFSSRNSRLKKEREYSQRLKTHFLNSVITWPMCLCVTIKIHCSNSGEINLWLWKCLLRLTTNLTKSVTNKNYIILSLFYSCYI